MGFYEPARTVAGQVQRGLGRAARQAPEAGVVHDCVRRDHRWWWAIDDRAVYLARLIRDFGLGAAPLLDRLRATDLDEDNNEFHHTLEVLEVLGRAGVPGVVDGIRRHVAEGPRPQDVLEAVARQWPVELWDDLLPVVRDRIAGPLRGLPWTHWAVRDPGLRVEAPGRPRVARPYAEVSDGVLVDVLRNPGRSGEHRDVLREFGRRPAVPDLLDVVETLTAGHLQQALAPLGAAVLPAARRWVAARGRRCWDGWQFLAAHGDESDVPLLLEGIGWLDERGDRCGYDVLVTGLARIGGPGTAGVPKVLRRLWLTPHSYERASYLRAYLALDAEGAEPGLVEGLWDCEQDVRMLAVRHVGLDPGLRDRLIYLRGDPIEAPEVRSAAAARLG